MTLDDGSGNGALQLPPSPLTRVVEVPPLSRVALPWHTLLFVFIASLVSGMVVALPLSRIGPNVLSVWVIVSAVLWLRYVPAAFTAAVADRVAPSCPRAIRWGVAMGVIGLLPEIEYFLEPQAPLSLWLWSWKWWMLGAAIRDACLGLALGWAVDRGRWALVQAAGIGAGIWGAYLALDFALGGIVLGAFPAAAWITAQVAVTLVLGGGSIGIVLVRGIRATWRRLHEPSEAERLE
jgi:hypothetical protein